MRLYSRHYDHAITWLALGLLLACLAVAKWAGCLPAKVREPAAYSDGDPEWNR